MKEISTRKRIIGLVVILAVFSVSALGFTLFLFTDLHGLAGMVNSSGSQRMRTILVSSFALQSYRTLIEDDADGTNQSGVRDSLRTQAKEELVVYEQILDELKSGISDRNIQEMIRRWDVKWRGFREDIDIVLTAETRTGATDAALARIDVEAANTLRKEISLIVAEIQNLSDNTVSRISIVFWAVILLFLLLSAIVAVTIHRSLIPLDALSDQVKALGEGNLTAQVISRRHDEIGRLGRGYNTTIDTIRRLITQLQESAIRTEQVNNSLTERLENTLNAAGTISVNAERTDGEFSGLADSIQSASSAVEQIYAIISSFGQRANDQASAVTQTTSAMEEMSASIQSVNRIAAERVRATVALSSLTDKGNEQLRHTVQLIESIGVRMDGILQMIAVINKVASQTNLLAMNAAIEAAHAGDAGRGFAVVADEIRNLSESTAKSAKEISGTLKELVSSTAEAVQASSDSGAAFEQIRQGVVQATDSFQEIGRSMEELSVGSSEVVHASESLLQISTHLQGSVSEMQTGAGEVNNALQEVIRTTGTVQESMGAIKNEAARVNLVSSAIGDSVNQNLTELENLLRQLSHFTISDEHTRAHSEARERILLSSLILTHAGWTAKARAVLDDTLRVNPDDLPDHHHCRLGVWMDETGRETITDTEVYAKLDSAHRSFHEQLYGIVTEHGKTDQAVLEGRYRTLVENSHSIVHLLTGVRDSIG